MGRQTPSLDAALGQSSEQRWHHAVDLAHGETHGRGVAAHRFDPRQAGEDLLGNLPVGFELDDVLRAERGDQRGGSAFGGIRPRSMIATRSQRRAASSM